MLNSSKDGNDDFNVEDIYTPLEVAKEEIWRRWNDKKLRKKVEDFLDSSIPKAMLNSPKAILARHIASPNNEFVKYLELAKRICLEPICLEYLDDKFRSENQDKYYLGKMFFCDGNGKKEGKRLNVKKVIDFDFSEGKRLADIKTLQGDSFIKFHHDLFGGFFNEYKNSITDESLWIKKNGGSPRIFYKKFLSLFICYGVLFENYLENKNEKEFTNSVVVPTFKKIYNIFGVKPLVVKIYPPKKENDLFWRHYPKFIEKTLK
ncbi:MAG: hypothetical protein ACD_7C00312G0005 [uncultured bacterium]|nr:MAG: hypothetical protein ACD_7C00312G0005 [uncultured bacterium]KKP67286.1 MAG: hypothetical protein UR66_C0018G0026 [Candidatus Moranbacteria bacterium GW2011_GWE1_35_17]KKP83319.1 MAG: hypothetical protein UR82_C0022G0012 [Candidatus Moranbacteria bacterium GW2011_GWF1_35_5]KKP84711.1 MAG: hypothetical protein UR83_C0014G0014 [Candidatus Moranbacteria bacterium GW2011_GWF2_35_54]HBR79312.1 hypothetical protein [Candidatus Moranbacteria bacterium]